MKAKMSTGEFFFMMIQKCYETKDETFYSLELCTCIFHIFSQMKSFVIILCNENLHSMHSRIKQYVRGRDFKSKNFHCLYYAHVRIKMTWGRVI